MCWRTSSSNMTSSLTRARSTESPGPVTTSSHIRSVSKPDHPALLLMPSGGVRLDRANGLLTTAIWASVCEAMSSSRRRTSGFRAGFEEGESRISERVTLIAARCCGVHVSSELGARSRERHLNGTLFENHTTSNHYLLVRARNVEIPSAALVCRKVGDMTTVKGARQHGKLCNSVLVRI